MSFVLDTDHCVAVLRGRLDVNRFVEPGAMLYITAITVSELIYGAHKSDRPEVHMAAIDELLAAVVVLPFDTSAARQTGQLKDGLRRAGLLPGEADLQIAGIVLSYGHTLVTHNRRHFERVPGLELVDWL
ncbi:MAG: tRNA(fMet)-specific endonuclease VapC [Chloroflexi bacterium ADurb.Bin325]|nr:MAG: tRNA(fMet)-specific endonuclease VapC [Chloroflexi bacterium ADurb.Bin325]